MYTWLLPGVNSLSGDTCVVQTVMGISWDPHSCPTSICNPNLQMLTWSTSQGQQENVELSLHVSSPEVSTLPEEYLRAVAYLRFCSSLSLQGVAWTRCQTAEMILHLLGGCTPDTLLPRRAVHSLLVWQLVAGMQIFTLQTPILERCQLNKKSFCSFGVVHNHKVVPFTSCRGYALEHILILIPKSALHRLPNTLDSQSNCYLPWVSPDRSNAWEEQIVLLSGETKDSSSE